MCVCVCVCLLKTVGRGPGSRPRRVLINGTSEEGGLPRYVTDAYKHIGFRNPILGSLVSVAQPRLAKSLLMRLHCGSLPGLSRSGDSKPLLSPKSAASHDDERGRGHHVQVIRNLWPGGARPRPNVAVPVPNMTLKRVEPNLNLLTSITHSLLPRSQCAARRAVRGARQPGAPPHQRKGQV